MHPPNPSTPHSDPGDRTKPLSVRLRPTAAADLPTLFEFQSDAESNTMAGTKPRTREVYFEAWERNLVDANINSRVIVVDGERGAEIAGSIARFQAPGEGGEPARDAVGYWIARAYWGKGIASRALALLLAEEHRRPLHATAAVDNAPSRHILAKCGFRCTGFRMGEETDRYVAREIAEFVLE